jgi:lipopolysaccharide transport protein LptA
MKTPGLILGAALLAWTASAQTQSISDATNVAVQPSTLEGAAAVTNAPATNTPVAQPAEIRITSDSGEASLDTRVAIHRGNVVATITDPIMRLTCDTLTIRVPREGEKPDHILAEGKVVIDHEGKDRTKTHATGDKALYVYSVTSIKTNETITLSGNSYVTNLHTGRSITGDPIIWDLGRNVVSYSNPDVRIQIEPSSTNGPNGSPHTNTPGRLESRPDSNK